MPHQLYMQTALPEIYSPIVEVNHSDEVLSLRFSAQINVAIGDTGSMSSHRKPPKAAADLGGIFDLPYDILPKLGRKPRLLVLNQALEKVFKNPIVT